MINQIAILTFVMFLFVIVPIWGIRSIIVDNNKTRNAGKELDSVENGLLKNLELLRGKDSSVFYGRLSHWMDSETEKIKTPWLKNALFLAADARYIGLGESHRALLKDEPYRRKTLSSFGKLARSLGDGNPEDVLHHLAHLYALFLCTGTGQTMTEKEGCKIATEALEKSIESYYSHNVIITESISNALKIIASSCSSKESTGVSLLVLRWALREFKDKKPDIQRIRNIINAKTDEGEFDLKSLRYLLLS